MMTLLAQTIADSSYWADPQTSTWTWWLTVLNILNLFGVDCVMF